MIALAALLHAIACPALPAANQAELALRAKLAIAYPAVTRWDISVLPSIVEPPAGNSEPCLSVTVTRLGQRSAVWVGSESLERGRHGTLLWFNVAGYSQAVVAARALPAGTSLDSGDGSLVESDIVRDNCLPLRDLRSLPGKRSRHFLQAGELICANLLEAEPAITRGEEVALIYTGRNFTLTTRAIAQSDGIEGKRVTVRNVSSGQVFAATVTGKGEVTVHE